MSLLTDNNLLPSRQYSEEEVINKFALDGTGLNGQLVALATGNQDPANSAGSYLNQAPLAAFTNVGNYKYNTLRRVRPTVASDTRYNTVGITLHTTAVYDENGNPLISQSYDKTLERGFVQTGFVVPILARGHVTLKTSMIVGTPFPGYVAVIANAGGGKIEAVAPTGGIMSGFLVGNLLGGTPVYSGSQIVGKFLSYSGSAFGGYAELKLEL
jgi:hypothetical protein